MYHLNLSILLSAAAALATPIHERQPSPSVTIQNGTVVGSSSLGIDSFKGIPFAQPPVGNLRLRPPQPLTQGFGTIQATAQPKACPQQSNQVDTSDLPSDVIGELMNSPLYQAVTNAGEDCLTVNVQRPSGTNATSKLPVLFWIFGGGFEGGSTSQYDGSSIVRRSIALDEPIVYVSVNYRSSGFGFLAGQELADEHSTNLGLRDQRLGLQWAAENVEAFGGDPEKVTIWGESSGSISVFDQTVVNGGDNTNNGKPLFRGAIMDSGSVIPAEDVTTSKPQAIFDTVAASAGCGSSTDKLSCLRAVDYTTFLNAVSSVPPLTSYSSLDLSYLPRPDSGDDFFAESPEISLRAGRFAKLPLIIGDQEDEGTLFALNQGNITTNEDLVAYLASYFPNSPNALEDVAALASNYPDQPLLGQPGGSPFNTGGLNNLYPQFKRLAAILGDITFTLTRRLYLHNLHLLPHLPQNPPFPTYSYISTYLHPLPLLGTFHGSDIIYAYGLLGDQDPITRVVQTYYVRFVNALDPNANGTVAWPQWSDEGGRIPQVLRFLGDGEVQVGGDGFREGAYGYLVANWSLFRV
ncbi:hypothetical protein M409DRAFT_25667 [Zasmidium cellare ATCC 36951]|uniref:Carboxylic ester hydrolase n=1 Tax=Zasmidium cellare ATCC 36951 TaxID=1080233 RepID=A0A6A6CE23_ZASCE|nr:uncharacterized protein M409DRAFT_25667 [Zasmidium cellare ATCC 36951]KAF2163889.1 hypothetical protein M409DRAFT_25667 [Zasmidium cellare ATCC 36951]